MVGWLVGWLVDWLVGHSLRQCCNHYFIVLMCLTMPALRTKRPTLEGLKDEYRRIMRLLELKKAGKQNSQEAEEEEESTQPLDDAGGVAGGGADDDDDPGGMHTPTRKRQSSSGTAATVSLTPTRRNGAFDLPVPLLADMLTPARRAGGSSAAAGDAPDGQAQICPICFNGLEVPSAPLFLLSAASVPKHTCRVVSCRAVLRVVRCCVSCVSCVSWLHF
jgi:hypothetical protein